MSAVFIVYFVVRAFWVGFIGLISVYEEGVRFEKLPFCDFYNKRMKSELGDSISLADILDRISSLIYLITFKLVLIMVALVIIFQIFFLIYNVIKLFIDQAIYDVNAGIL